VVAYNWIHDNLSRGVGVGVYLDNAAGGYTIHHNVIWNIPSFGVSFSAALFVDSSGVTYTANDNVAYNNTFYNNGSDVYVYDPARGADVRTMKGVNNIFTATTKFPPDAVEQNNLHPPTDPLFVAASRNNFQLRSGSPANLGDHRWLSWSSARPGSL